MAFDAYGDIDYPGLEVFCGAIVLAYGIGGLTNFFLRRPFVSDAVLAVVVMAVLAFGVLQFIPRDAGRMGADYKGMDWRVVPASALILDGAADPGGAGAGLLDARGSGSDAGDLFGACFCWGWCRIIFGERGPRPVPGGHPFFTR